MPANGNWDSQCVFSFYNFKVYRSLKLRGSTGTNSDLHVVAGQVTLAVGETDGGEILGQTGQKGQTGQTGAVMFSSPGARQVAGRLPGRKQ